MNSNGRRDCLKERSLGVATGETRVGTWLKGMDTWAILWARMDF